MVDRSNTPNIDIAEAEYSGPSAAVIALGHGVIQHLAWAMYATGAAGIAAFVFHKPAARLLKESRTIATEWKAIGDPGFVSGLKRGAGRFIHAVFGVGEGGLGATHIARGHREWLDHSIMHREHGFGHWLASHTIGLLPIIGGKVNRFLDKAGKVDAPEFQQRLTEALTFGGAFGGVGYVAGWLQPIFFGYKRAQENRDKYITLQQMLRDSRSEIDSLKIENNALKIQQPQPAQHDVAPSSAQHHAERREPIKAPEQDWVSDIAAQKEAAAQQEKAIG